MTYYYKFLTAEELLRFYARILACGERKRTKRIDQLLKPLNWNPARKRPIKSYSKGMQQRIGSRRRSLTIPIC